MNDLTLGMADTRTQRSDADAPLEEIVLVGQPSLEHYLDIIRDIAVDGDKADLRTACDEWRRANDTYHELEETEANIADQAECLDLDPTLEPLAETLQSDPYFRHTFDTLPTRIAMVELDRLVTFQTQVTRQFIDSIRLRLGPSPEPQTLFRLCLPTGPRDLPLAIRRTGSRRWTFSSDCTDLHFQKAVLLKPEQINGLESFGPVGGVLGLMVGFGSNQMNVIRSDTRMLLNNGYHRALALRALGITHAPCIVQTVTRRAELALAAAQRVIDDPYFYFKSARPPLLKDFFDPRVSKILPVHRMKKVIEVSFETRGSDVVD